VQVGVQVGRADGGHAQVHGLAGGPHDPAGLVDLAALGVAELLHVGLDPADKRPGPG
jgi:hypothetical protein